MSSVLYLTVLSTGSGVWQRASQEALTSELLTLECLFEVLGEG